MSVAPSVSRQVGADGLVLSLVGDWTIAHGSTLETNAAEMSALGDPAKDAVIDLSHIGHMDTAGAWLIDRARFQLTQAGVPADYRGARPEYALLLKDAGYRPLEAPKRTRASHVLTLLTTVGETAYATWTDLNDILDYLGEIVATWWRLALTPWRWRWTSVFYHLETYSLRSVPLIALINFLVGAIIMQQGIYQLGRFGASDLAVNMLGVLGLRELAVLMTSIMIAGRTGSAITAELGSMNMREEIDALRVMALDPLEVLVMPRLVALAIALPILTFIGGMAQLFAGLVVGFFYSGMAPIVFISRLHNAIGPHSFLEGLIKAPFMAVTIGLIASTEGMEVRGSAESLGRCVTSSVVKSIFMVIVLDVLFVVFFTSIDW